jgi:hypothetical protein
MANINTSKSPDLDELDKRYALKTAPDYTIQRIESLEKLT